jgi:hypothetical protein
MVPRCVSQWRDPEDDDKDINNLEGIGSRVDGSPSRTDLIHMERVGSLPTKRIKRAEAHACLAPPNSTPHECSVIAKLKIAQNTQPSNITSVTSSRSIISPSLLEHCRPPNESSLAHPNNNIDATLSWNFSPRLNRLLNFRRLSRAERRLLLSKVMRLLDDESLLSNLDGAHVSRHCNESDSNADESPLLLSSCDGERGGCLDSRHKQCLDRILHRRLSSIHERRCSSLLTE